ncbi:MAG: hypothetical protein ACTIJ6_06060 [Leucobacter sp.]
MNEQMPKAVRDGAESAEEEIDGMESPTDQQNDSKEDDLKQAEEPTTTVD